MNRQDAKNAKLRQDSNGFNVSVYT